MKTPIRIVLTVVLAMSLPSQLWSQGYFEGTVRFDNLANTNASLTATSGGLVFYLGSGTTYHLLDHDVNFMLVGGPSLDQMIPIHEWVLQSGGKMFAPTSSAVGISTGGGHFQDPSGGVYQIFNVAPGQVALLKIYAWDGRFMIDPYRAVSSGWGSIAGPFTVTTGFNAFDAPDMSGMSAITIGVVPEPSPAALAGLALAIFGFRRWHKRSR